MNNPFHNKMQNTEPHQLSWHLWIIDPRGIKIKIHRSINLRIKWGYRLAWSRIPSCSSRGTSLGRWRSWVQIPLAPSYGFIYLSSVICRNRTGKGLEVNADETCYYDQQNLGCAKSYQLYYH